MNLFFGKPKKIKTKVFITFLFVSLLFIVASIAGYYYYSGFLLRNEIFSRLETVADLEVAHIEGILSGKKDQLIGLAFDEFVANALPKLKESGVDRKALMDDLSHHLVSHKAHMDKFIYEIFVLDVSGVVVGTTNPEKKFGDNFSNDNIFTKAKADVFIKDVFFDEEFGGNALVFSTFITNEDVFLGVIAMRVSSDILNDALLGVSNLGKTGEVYLVNENGYMITSSRFEEDTVLKKRIDTENSKECFNDMRKYGSATSVVEEYEEEMLVFPGYRENVGMVFGAHSYLPEMNWCLLVEMSDKEAGVPLNNLIVFTVFLASVTILIIFIISNFIGNRLSKPIENLRRGVKIVEEGNLDHKVDSKSLDEIGQLSRSFDKMTSSIKKSYADVDKKIKRQTLEMSKKQKVMEGQQKAMLNVLEDVEEEKEKSQNLAQDLRKFQLAVGSASDHIVITDPDGIVLYMNKAAEKITGYSEEEVLGKKAGVKDLWGGNMEKEFYDNLWDTIKNKKETLIGEVKNTRKNGEDYEASVSISPIINSAGEVEFFVGIERDITKEKQIEKMKTEFVSVASHQLKTPLTGISWLIEVFEKDKEGKLSKKQKEYLGDIYESSQRMTRLVTDLLNVSRLEGGTLKITPKPSDFVSIIKDVIKEHGLISARKDCDIVFEQPEEKLEPVLLDDSLISQVIQNLLINAVRYSKEGDCKVDIKLEKRKDDYLVSIIDSGIGIPKGAQDRIFVKFFRADNAQKLVTDGTGLGLYIAKMILEASGGKIWFESEKDEGSTFYVSIPLGGMRGKGGGKRIGLTCERLNVIIYRISR